MNQSDFERFNQVQALPTFVGASVATAVSNTMTRLVTTSSADRRRNQSASHRYRTDAEPNVRCCGRGPGNRDSILIAMVPHCLLCHDA